MKILTKIPLYLGLSMFVLAIVVSAIKLGERNSQNSLQSRASSTNSTLTLRYSAPDLVSITLSAAHDVAGVDAVIEFDKDKIIVMPSTLVGGPKFLTTGGLTDESLGTFSFSALAKEQNIQAGIVATFTIAPKNAEKIDTVLKFVKGEGKTAVIDRTTGENTLGSAEALDISL